MSSRRKGHVASNSKALAKTTIFGPPPILMGEDERVYDDLLEKVSSDIKPKGIIEQILIKDVVDLTYELFRLRGLKAAWLSDIIPDCLEEFLSAIRGHRKTKRAILLHSPVNLLESGLKAIGLRMLEWKNLSHHGNW